MRTLLLALSSLLLFSGCLGRPLFAPRQRGGLAAEWRNSPDVVRVHGRVTGSCTGAPPVRGHLVRLVNPSGQALAQAITGVDGSFTVSVTEQEAQGSWVYLRVGDEEEPLGTTGVPWKKTLYATATVPCEGTPIASTTTGITVKFTGYAGEDSRERTGWVPFGLPAPPRTK